MKFFEKISLTLQYFWKKGYIVPFVSGRNNISYFNTRTWKITKN